MKLWIDECLSPTLVERANLHGYWATCNRDRDLLGIRDDALRQIVLEEEAVLVTNNEVDFAALYQGLDLHTGLLVLPQTDGREKLWPLFEAAVSYIECQADDAREPAAEWMLNMRVDVDADGTVCHAGLSSPK